MEPKHRLIYQRKIIFQIPNLHFWGFQHVDFPGCNILEIAA